MVGIDRHRDTVNVKFGENAAIDPEKLMRFVATKKGANFSPQGVLKYTLVATAAEQVLGNSRIRCSKALLRGNLWPQNRKPVPRRLAYHD